MSERGDSVTSPSDSGKTGGCPSCGAPPEEIVERDETDGYTPGYIGSHYCGACFCELGGRGV